MAWREHAIFGKVDAEGVVNQKVAMTTGPGTGITAVATALTMSSIQRHGNIVKTQIMIDLTGLRTGGADLDIIGKDGDTANCHFGSLLASESGAIWSGKMTCLEVPTGGIDDIDLYEATVATGVQETGVGALTETALVTAGGSWTLGMEKPMIAIPTVGEYLYICNGASDTTTAFTAGRFLIEFTGYLAD